MKILAIDTSSAVLSLGVFSDGVMLGELVQNKALTHSERLMPHIEYLLSTVDEKIQDMDRFAVTVGPGSFTGIRIGVATANAFAMAYAKKVIAISTLDALAYNLKYFDGYILSTMYAQREDYYRAIYSFRDGEMLKHGEEEALSKELLLKEAFQYAQKKPVIIIGELSPVLQIDSDFLQKNVEPHTKNAIIRLGSAADNYVRGAMLCEIASRDSKEQSGYASPVYIRKPQAEVQLEEKLRLSAEVKK